MESPLVAQQIAIVYRDSIISISRPDLHPDRAINLIRRGDGSHRLGGEDSPEAHHGPTLVDEGAMEARLINQIPEVMKVVKIHWILGVLVSTLRTLIVLSSEYLGILSSPLALKILRGAGSRFQSGDSSAQKDLGRTLYQRSSLFSKPALVRSVIPKKPARVNWGVFSGLHGNH
jgi:hypothetical protein